MRLRLSMTSGVIALVMASFLTAMAEGQERERRRQFVEGLLRTLIDSQMDKQDLRPPQPPAPLSPAVGQARATLRQFTGESTRLIELLQNDMRRAPGLRHHLNDALQVKAAATVLASQTERVNQLDPLAEEVRRLDAQWRLVAHRVGQTPGVSPACLESVQRLNVHNVSLRKLFGIQPQLDRREIVRLCDSLHRDMQHLCEDIDIELGRQLGGRQLLIEAHRVEHQAKQVLASFSGNAPPDAAITEFKRFSAVWQPLATRLRKVQDRHLERSLTRVDETNREIHERLLLPLPVDYGQLVYLCDALSAHVNELFERVTLNVLIESPKANNVVNISGEFYGLCEHFKLAISQREPVAVLAEDFQLLERSWPTLEACFKTTRDPNVVRSLKEIEHSFAALRRTLGLRPTLDRVTAGQLASGLEVLAGQIRTDLQRFVLLDRTYPQLYRAETLEHATQFRDQARHLHEELAGTASDAVLRQDCHRLAQTWTRLHDTYLVKLRPNIAVRVNRSNDRIGAALVQLQTMLEF